MEHPFIISFKKFLDSAYVRFAERANTFYFPEHNFIVHLVFVSPHQEVENAMQSNQCTSGQVDFDAEITGDNDLLYLYEDRWNFNREFTKCRILTRLGLFNSIFARKCSIVTGREAGDEIQHFLEKYHSYGYAKSKYRYALMYEDKMVAVAAFSEPRPMVRNVDNLFSYVSPSNKHADLNNNAVVFQSYEWVRYASLPDVRVVGGMGKLLFAFLDEAISKNAYSTPTDEFFRKEHGAGNNAQMFSTSHKPVEVMTYSDNEWSTGSVYKTLGFTQVGERAPVEFFVNKTTFERLSQRKLQKILPADIQETAFWNIASQDYYTIENKGSRKFLLQII